MRGGSVELGGLRTDGEGGSADDKVGGCGADFVLLGKLLHVYGGER